MRTIHPSSWSPYAASVGTAPIAVSSGLSSIVHPSQTPPVHVVNDPVHTPPTSTGAASNQQVSPAPVVTVTRGGGVTSEYVTCNRSSAQATANGSPSPVIA